MLSHGLMLIDHERETVTFQKFAYDRAGSIPQYIVRCYAELEADGLGIAEYASQVGTFFYEVIEAAKLPKPLIVFTTQQ